MHPAPLAALHHQGQTGVSKFVPLTVAVTLLPCIYNDTLACNVILLHVKGSFYRPVGKQINL
jgi:hypothetical protein